MYNSIDNSSSRVFSGASLTGGEYTAVMLTGEGLSTATATSVPLGLLTEEPLGEDVNVQVTGGGLWLTGEDVTAGDLLSAGEAGKAFKATTGSFIFAQALESGLAGGAVRVQIINGGYKG